MAQTVFRSASPLSNDTIARYAPSILAAEAHESRGQRYTFIPTVDVLDGLRAEGFQPFEVRQTHCRDEGKREHTKHMVRLRHPDAVMKVDGDAVPEIILVNSHDGSSSYQLLAGLYRLVCSNGMVACEMQTDDVRIRHTGHVIEDVIEGSFRVLDNIKHVEDRVDIYKGIQLSSREQLLLADAASEIRWGSDENGTSRAPIFSNDQLIQARRREDRKDDLWTTFNRIQENVIQGGIRGRSANGRRTRTREVGGVNENVKLNRALWKMADEFAKLKLAA